MRPGCGPRICCTQAASAPRSAPQESSARAHLRHEVAPPLAVAARRAHGLPHVVLLMLPLPLPAAAAAAAPGRVARDRLRRRHCWAAPLRCLALLLRVRAV